MAICSACWSAIKICALSLYIAYWALILPFLCWGAWATPGHPHLHPHFVFSPPLTADDAHGKTAADCHITGDSHQDHAASGYDQDAIAGESTPSIGVLSMLAVIVTSLSQHTHTLPAGSVCAPAVQFPPGHLVRVTTPPPRGA